LPLTPFQNAPLQLQLRSTKMSQYPVHNASPQIHSTQFAGITTTVIFYPNHQQ
jgi:hypothetical protein